MGRGYALPPGLQIDELSPDELEALAERLEPRGSLPVLQPRVRLEGLSIRALAHFAQSLRSTQIALARERADAFIQYAIPHELTERPITNAPHHIAWHRHLDANDWAVIFAPVEHGKTQQIAVGRVLWALGRNPNLRIALVSNTASQAEKVLAAIKTHIERNPRVREVFPNLMPSEEGLWTQSRITIKRSSYAKDPTIQALGVDGPIVGSRVDVLVLDDVLDLENTRTPEQLQKLKEWWETTAFTRLYDSAEDGMRSKVWAIGTPWNRHDLLHHLASLPGFGVRTDSAVHNPEDPAEEWRPLWPRQFPPSRLQKIYANTTPHNFARKYLCRVRDEARARFQESWIAKCLELGRGRTILTRAPIERIGGPRLACFTGVDLGIGENEEHDLTVLFTIALMADQRRLVCDIRSGRWTAPEILAKIETVHQMFDSIVLVESVAAQKYIAQFAAKDGIPVVPFYTGKNKTDPDFGIETLSVEMRSEQWIIPSGKDGSDVHEEVRSWISEMVFYAPGAHTGDRLMASWFAREGARNYGGSRVRRADLQRR